jgi:hypothetical protein
MASLHKFQIQSSRTIECNLQSVQGNRMVLNIEIEDNDPSGSWYFSRWVWVVDWQVVWEEINGNLVLSEQQQIDAYLKRIHRIRACL